MTLRLVYLYGDLMNLYGDRGNILTLQRRCAWRGIALDVREATVGHPIDPDQTDLLFFGGGQDREQTAVSEDLARGNGAAIKAAVAQGAALLSICGGYQLLGHFFRTTDGLEIPGTGLFDVHTVAGPTRNVGNVVATATLDGVEHSLVGFENHSGRTYLGPGATPFAKVTVGNGNNAEDGSEGVWVGSAIGTYLHGPLLPKNPWLADWLIATALRRRTGTPSLLDPLDDHVEATAHTVMRDRILRAGNHRTSIR